MLLNGNECVQRINLDLIKFPMMIYWQIGVVLLNFLKFLNILLPGAHTMEERAVSCTGLCWVEKLY